MNCIMTLKLLKKLQQNKLEKVINKKVMGNGVFGFYNAKVLA
jgi:hypothetical protein